MLGMDFVDIDKHIVDSQNRSIKDIFASDGEKNFRTIEYNSLKNICEKTNQVVSTGGGLPVYSKNRNFYMFKTYFFGMFVSKIIKHLVKFIFLFLKILDKFLIICDPIKME